MKSYNEIFNLCEASINVKGRKIEITKPHKSPYKIVWINVSIFDKAFSEDKSFYIGAGGKGEIKGRYKRFGNFVLGGTEDIGDFEIEQKPANSIEVSQISVNDKGKIGFTNGRHRYAWLRDNGVNPIPAVMDTSSIKNAKKFNYVK